MFADKLVSLFSLINFYTPSSYNCSLKINKYDCFLLIEIIKANFFPLKSQAKILN